jgi:hypothetical protein
MHPLSGEIRPCSESEVRYAQGNLRCSMRPIIGACLFVSAHVLVRDDLPILVHRRSCPDSTRCFAAFWRGKF